MNQCMIMITITLYYDRSMINDYYYVDNNFGIIQNAFSIEALSINCT